jgi:hypothetical protein
MILSSLLILALVVASGILLSPMLLPFQLPRVSADSSDTNTDQDLRQRTLEVATQPTPTVAKILSILL